MTTASIIGLGYIGLPTAGILARSGVTVYGYDVNPSVVETINQGRIHIIEPELDACIAEGVTAGRLKAFSAPQPADVFIIAVPTPFMENHKPDLRYIEQACETIAPVLQKGNLVILESTSPVGTTEKMATWLSQFRHDLCFPMPTDQCIVPDIHIAHCPERVLPGKILYELVHNARIIGGCTPACTEKARAFYSLFVKGKCLLTNARTAELSKLTENAYRDVNIAFANELSMICDELNIDVSELIALANHHPRVNILSPGCGVGGHCLAVDPWFIVDACPETAKLIHTSRQVNDNKPRFVIDKLKAAVSHISHPKIACLGITYKPNIDDLRESPALFIVERLSKELPNATLYVIEPNVENCPARLSKQTNLCYNPKTIAKIDALLLLVNHQVFLAENFWTETFPNFNLETTVQLDTTGIAYCHR